MKSILRVLMVTSMITITLIGYNHSSLHAISPLNFWLHTQSDSVLLADISFTPPPPPPNRGAPGSRGEGASRGECLANQQGLTALVPLYQQPQGDQGQAGDVTQVWGLTVSDRPSFWFYLPYTTEQIRSIEFVLQTNQDETLVRMPVPQPAGTGIMQVKLPDSAPPLAAGNLYHWFFKVRVVCQGQSANETATLDYVEGWIERSPTDPTIGASTVQPLSLQQAELYAEHGIWYDALTILAELRLANPADSAIATDWKNLLRSIGLENLADHFPLS
jgi:hypothetical protein